MSEEVIESNKKILAIALMAVAMLALQISRAYTAKSATMTRNARPLAIASETDGEIDISWVPRDTSEYIGISDAIPTDPSYFLWDSWGGTWSDAEKRPPDDGVGNPPPDNPGDEDDKMCWAATCSNVLEWTGWGLVSGMWDSDQIFQFYLDHWYDLGGKGEYGWNWWFDGTTPPADGSYVDVAGGGDFWDPPYHFGDYWTQNDVDKEALEAIDNYLHEGRGIYLSVDGHAITCWGFSYDSADPDYYVGVYVTDSDDSKGSAPPAPNLLRYYEVEYNSDDERWYLQNYYGSDTWYIHRVEGLMQFPSTRPVADAGGPYVGYEGSAITFDGSGSSDADGDTLQYRWDFDNDGVWDTGWAGPTASHTWYEDYSGTVVLQVYDGHMLDVDNNTVTVNNVAPTVEAGSDQTVEEGDTVSFSGSFTDPGTSDTHTIHWSFGNTATATGTLTPTLVYDDNGVYTVTLTVNDDDGGVGTDTLIVTVNNGAPIVDAGPDQTVDEGDTVSFSGSYTDPGTGDTHTVEWDFDDGSIIGGTLTPAHAYGDDGVYTVMLTVTDDDGGVGTDTLTVTVLNVVPSTTPLAAFTVDEGAQVSLAILATDPGSDDLTFTWDWGDGSSATVTIYYNDGVGPDPHPSPGGTYPFSATDTVQHIYGDNSVYTVTLTVNDDDGLFCLYSTTATVNNVAPSISLSMASPNPDNPEFLLPIVHEPLFTGSATDPGSDDLEFTWDWGDGTQNTTIHYNDGAGPDPYPSPEGTYPFSATDTPGHVYALPGTYTLTFTVEDDDGGVIFTTREVKVLSVEEAKEIIEEYILGLPDAAFVGNPAQRKKAFGNMFSAIDDMLTDQEYWGAATAMFQNIRAKADGKVDGYLNNDWITDATAQKHICWKIDALTSYLKTLVV